MSMPTTTTTTSSRKDLSRKHTPVPLLLSSFPAPPSFIPPSPNPANVNVNAPTHSPNPPPSLPPSSPLPPVPGPSPLSDHDALLFLAGRVSRASTSSSSRRASNLSINPDPPPTNRDSLASSHSPSRHSIGAPGPTCSPRDSLASASSRSTRSFSGSSSTGAPTPSSASSAPPRTPSLASDNNRPSIAFSISEEDPQSAVGVGVGDEVRLENGSDDKVTGGVGPHKHTREPGRLPLVVSPEPILNDDDILPPSTGLYRSKPNPPMTSTSSYDDDAEDDFNINIEGNESLADIDVRGVLGGSEVEDADGDDDSDLEFVLNHSSKGRGGGNEEVLGDSADADVLALHRSIRATRSRSGSHRLNLASKSRTKSPPPPLPLSPNPSLSDNATESTPTSSSITPTSAPPITPKTAISSFHHKNIASLNNEEEDLVRASSPDIKEILAATPRPAKSQIKSRSKSRSRAGSRASSVCEGNRVRSTSTRSAPGSRRTTTSGVGRRRASSTYAVSSPGGGGVNEFGVLEREESWDDGFGEYEDGHVDVEAEMKLERALEGAGSDSDSSLDLHTPLPHLMVRHGMLSPNSKLLPQACATPTTDGRPGSVASVKTTITKSGVIKDERDTPQRRSRHRDGSLLRGGIGLTTGLGWSDSEDEDAPSALTRRLSTLNLSRRSSTSSIRSSPSSHQSFRTSSYSYHSINSLHSSYSTHSMRSSGSMHSLKRHPLARSYSSGTLLEERDEEYLRDGEDDEVYQSFNYPTKGRSLLPSSTTAPPSSWPSLAGKSTSRNSTSTRNSTASGSSLTPDGDHDDSYSHSYSQRSYSPGGKSFVNRNKHLPPLPLSRQASSASVRSVRSTVAVVECAEPPPPLPSSRSTSTLVSVIPGSNSSTISLNSSTGARTAPTTPTTPSGNTNSNRIPRPLQLPRHTNLRTANKASPSSSSPLPSSSSSAVAVGDRPAVPVPSVPQSQVDGMYGLGAANLSSGTLSPSSNVNGSGGSTGSVGSTKGTKGSVNGNISPLQRSPLGKSFGFSSGREAIGERDGVGLSTSMSSPSLLGKGVVGVSGGGEIPKPKPRTGTGMVYRTGTGTSRMRVPSAPLMQRSRTTDVTMSSGQKTVVL